MWPPSALYAALFVEGVGKSTALVARNPDIVSGGCAFNWASFPLNAVFEPHAFTVKTTVDDKGLPIEIDEITGPGNQD